MLSPEHFPSEGRSPEEIEHERLIRHFEEGTCPYCENRVNEIHINDHYGFCSERHKYEYETKHSLDVSLDFKRTHADHLHTQYLERQAEELDIPVEFFRKLHDDEHRSPAEIRAEIEEYKRQKAA